MDKETRFTIETNNQDKAERFKKFSNTSISEYVDSLNQEVEKRWKQMEVPAHGLGAASLKSTKCWNPEHAERSAYFVCTNPGCKMKFGCFSCYSSHSDICKQRGYTNVIKTLLDRSKYTDYYDAKRFKGEVQAIENRILNFHMNMNYALNDMKSRIPEMLFSHTKEGVIIDLIRQRTKIMNQNEGRE